MKAMTQTYKRGKTSDKSVKKSNVVQTGGESLRLSKSTSLESENCFSRSIEFFFFPDFHFVDGTCQVGGHVQKPVVRGFS